MGDVVTRVGNLEKSISEFKGVAEEYMDTMEEQQRIRFKCCWISVISLVVGCLFGLVVCFWIGLACCLPKNNQQPKSNKQSSPEKKHVGGGGGKHEKKEKLIDRENNHRHRKHSVEEKERAN